MSPEYLKAAAELINSIAWPFVLLVFLVLYRKKLSTLFEHIEEVKWGSASAKIRREINKMVKTVPENAQPTPPNEQQLDVAQRIEELSLSRDNRVRSSFFTLHLNLSRMKTPMGC